MEFLTITVYYPTGPQLSSRMKLNAKGLRSSHDNQPIRRNHPRGAERGRQALRVPAIRGPRPALKTGHHGAEHGASRRSPPGRAETRALRRFPQVLGDGQQGATERVALEPYRIVKIL